MKLRLFPALLLAFIPAFADSAATSERERPNLIFILADDLGYGDLGCFGQQEISTPNLDRLAAEGMRFTNAYAGSTVCAPSRCVLMTGLHTGHATVRGNRREPGGRFLESGDITVAEVLKPAGYATGLIGKWGLGEPGETAAGMPTRQGFDHFYGYLNQTHAHNSYPSHLWRNETRVPLLNTVPDELPNGAGVSDNKAQFSQDLFIEEALGFIRANQRGPFFLCFAPTLPHANNESQPFGLEIPNDGFYASRTDWPEAKRAWAAMVSRLDYDVGRIIRELQLLGLDGKTLVVFTSDNGPHKESGADPEFFNSSGPFRGFKRSLHEGGIRVPTLARWPGRVPAGVTSDSPWYFADVLPTFADAGGAAVPERTDGISILPTLLGARQPELDERLLYWEFHEGGFQTAARRGNWKAIRKHVSLPLELYDLAADPGETTNVAGGHPRVIAGFDKAMKEARSPSDHWPVIPGALRSD